MRTKHSFSGAATYQLKLFSNNISQSEHTIKIVILCITNMACNALAALTINAHNKAIKERQQAGWTRKVRAPFIAGVKGLLRFLCFPKNIPQ